MKNNIPKLGRHSWLQTYAQSTMRFVGVLLMVAILSSPQTASALSAEQTRAFELGLFKVQADRPCDETASSTTNTIPADASSDERLQYIYTWFRGRGLTAIQAAAAVGNIAVESGGIANRVQGAGIKTNNDPAAAGSSGWGLIQWTPGSKIIGIAAKAGVTGPIHETNTQLEIVLWHMKNTSPTGASNMLAGFNQTDITEAVYYFERKIEGAGKPAYSVRTARAKNALEKYESSSALAYTSTNTSDADSTNASALAVSGLEQSGCAPTGTALSAGGDASDAGLIALIQKYAWPTPNHTPTGDQTDAYKAAIAKAKAAGKYIGGSNGNDCGGFITRLMQDSGRDPRYGGGGNTSAQIAYLRKHTELYKQVKFSEVKFGDIGIWSNGPGDGHTFMYIGTAVPGFKHPVVEAAFRRGEASSAPRNINSLKYNNSQNAIYFRYIGGSNSAV